MKHSHRKASKRQSSRAFTRHALACAIGGSAAIMAGVTLPCKALAQTAAADTRSYSVPAGALEDALNRFGREAGILLSFTTQSTAGLRSKGLQGSYTVQGGLDALLAGSGLLATRQANGSYVLRQVPAAPTAASDPKEAEATLPTVRIVAPREVETAAGPVAGYVATRSATATKTDTPIIETPQSISVITRDRMDDQAVQTTTQALRYTAGVLTEVTGYDLRYQSFIVRGFDAANYRDGLRTFGGTYGDWVAEPQGLERVELLKGPASVLYGQSTPGGLMNQISKRPSLDAPNQIAVTVGNHDRYQTSFDVGGSANEDGTVLYRLNGLARDSKAQTDYSKDNRLFLAPSISWRPSASTSLTVLADITQDRVTPKSFWPDYALTDANPNGKIPRSRFAGEPGFDHYNRDMKSVAYLFEHQLSEDWTLKQSARYAEFELDYQHVYGDSWQDDLRTINRNALASQSHGRSLTIDNQAQTKFKGAGFDHKVLLGLDYQDFAGREDVGYGVAPPLDVFAPVYGAPVTMPDTARSHSKLTQTGLYAQDQIRAGAWIANIGLRRDQATTRNWDDASTSLTQRDSKMTHNLGLMYLTDSGFAPYGSYATSFNPSVNVGFDGTAFKPETGKQFELGVKYQPKGSNSMVTVSVFDLRKQNVTTEDPDHPGYSVQTGEVRSRGIELESITTLNRQLDLIAAITHLDARVTRSNDASELGKHPTQTATDVASVWLDYRFSDEVLRGWSVGGGLRHVGKVPANTANTQFNPAYTLVDLAVRYKTGPVTIALNAANVFDKTYVANQSEFYGQGRAAQATVAYRW
jgi:iron complex outermembrane recepter protein